MLKVLPKEIETKLTSAIFKSTFEEVKRILEQNAIDVNSFVDDKDYDPLIMEALRAYSYKEEKSQEALVHYLLQQGADVNRKNKAGYNCLHVAINDRKLLPMLELFLQFRGDVNEPDGKGATVTYWAIQSFPAQGSDMERAKHLKVIEHILSLGGNMDQPNNFGVTPRDWLKHKTADLKSLVEKYDELKPAYTPPSVGQPEFTSKLKYPEIARTIWQTLVPSHGQAPSVQGELLRAIEKLRDEAQRNGNINYNKSHKKLVEFIQTTLAASGIWDAQTVLKLKTETKKLRLASRPYLEDDTYDFLTDLVCEFFITNPTIVTRHSDPQITC
jgi:hypothetical protein